MSHHHEAETMGSRLIITFGLNSLIAVVEIIGGFISGSLSLISDALHNFSDAVAVVISYIAIKLNERPRNERYTFGYKRAQIFAALINSSVLILISLYLLVEAYKRFVNPEPISGDVMLIVASIGLIANVTGTLLLRAGAKDNMNIRASYLHLLSDSLSSVGVIIGGTFIYFLNTYWIDPLITVLISLYILKESYAIVKEAAKISLMASPPNISIMEIKKRLEKLDGVLNIHHIHLWQLDEKHIHFEAHAEVPDLPVSETDKILKQIQKILKNEFEIEHVTVQFESTVCEEEKF